MVGLLTVFLALSACGSQTAAPTADGARATVARYMDDLAHARYADACAMMTTKAQAKVGGGDASACSGPAQRLLTRAGDRGDVRFSILHAQDDEFVMADERGLFPALGHRVESRQAYSLPIAGSFSQLAYERNRVFWSSGLSDDDRFDRHPEADPDRHYESIVSVPIRGEGGGPIGVLNVIATNPDAFSEVDRTYISLLGSVVDVALATAGRPSGSEETPEDVSG